VELKQKDLQLLSKALRKAKPTTRRARMLGFTRAAEDEKVEVLGGFLDDELQHLARHSPMFCDCAMARLVRLISVRFKEGGLQMPPPIVSRIYQELSNGSLSFHQAHKITKVPFPFPYAQLLSIMMVYFMLTVPLAIVCFTRNDAMAVLLSGSASFTFVALNEVALELEDPFGSDANDLPLFEMHNSFNTALSHLLHMRPPECDNLKSANYWKMQSAMRVARRSSVSKISRQSILGLHSRVSSVAIATTTNPHLEVPAAPPSGGLSGTGAQASPPSVISRA